MFGRQSARDSAAPLFVLATRLFVHYKVKTRQTLDPSVMLVDDACVLADWQIEWGSSLYAVYLPTRYLAPKVRVFVDFLVEKFGVRK